MRRYYSTTEAAYPERLEGVLQTQPDKKILHVSLTPRVTGVDIFGQVAKWYAKNESRQDREKLKVRRSDRTQRPISTDFYRHPASEVDCEHNKKGCMSATLFSVLPYMAPPAGLEPATH